MRGAGKCGVDLGGVAIVIVERYIVGDVVVKLWRAGLGGFGGVGDGGKRVDVELDGFGRIARPCQRLGDDEGNGIADEAHLVGRKRRTVGLQQG